METVNLIKELEKISSELPHRVLRLEGIFIHNQELIEVIIFKGFSLSLIHI